MIGIGLFVNTTVLAQSLGGFGWAAYAVLAVLLLPLILSIAKLLQYILQADFIPMRVNHCTRLQGLSAHGAILLQNWLLPH